MSEPKHTPGPWKIDARNLFALIIEDSTKGLAMVAGRSVDERIANAALIAAAPDMLAFIVRLTEIVGDSGLAGAEYEEAIALIKKASNA